MRWKTCWTGWSASSPTSRNDTHPCLREQRQGNTDALPCLVPSTSAMRRLRIFVSSPSDVIDERNQYACSGSGAEPDPWSTAAWAVASRPVRGRNGRAGSRAGTRQRSPSDPRAGGRARPRVRHDPLVDEQRFGKDPANGGDRLADADARSVGIRTSARADEQLRPRKAARGDLRAPGRSRWASRRLVGRADESRDAVRPVPRSCGLTGCCPGVGCRRVGMGRRGVDTCGDRCSPPFPGHRPVEDLADGPCRSPRTTAPCRRAPSILTAPRPENGGP